MIEPSGTSTFTYTYNVRYAVFDLVALIHINAQQIKSVADAFISIFQIKFSKENVIPQSIGAKPALHLQCLSTFEKNVSVEINEVS